MSPTTIATSLEGFDFDAATEGDLAKAGDMVQRLRGFLNAVDGKIARRATDLHGQGQCIPPDDLISRSQKSSLREASRTRRRAEVLGHVPAVDKQLAEGRISNEHADAISNAANQLDADQRIRFLTDDTELAQAAAAMTPRSAVGSPSDRADQMLADGGIERSERQREQTYLSMGVNEETGMGYVCGELHPEAFQRVRRAIDGEVGASRKLPENEGLRTEQLNAVALVNVATGPRSAGKRKRAEVAVHIDHATLATGAHADSLCEYSDGTPLPVETARRIACDAEIIPIVLGGDGVLLDVGRSRRLATPEQRLALRAMYRTCAIDGCDRAFGDCEIHHLLEWLDDGHTDLINLLPVSSHHHHCAHEGRWRLELDADTRQLSVWLATGTLLCRCLPDIISERSTGPSTSRAARPSAARRVARTSLVVADGPRPSWWLVAAPPVVARHRLSCS